MSQPVELVLYLVVVGLGAALEKIAPFIPASYATIVGTVIAILGTLAAALRITPPAATATIKDLGARVDRMSAHLGKSGTGGALAILMACGALTAICVGGEACSPAQGAVWAHVEQVVLDDLAKGEGAEQIESEIANILCTSTNSVPGQLCVDAVIVLNDVLTALIDMGVIPANLIPKATAMLAEVAPTAAAHRAAAGRP